jgi:hypothetical protein
VKYASLKRKNTTILNKEVGMIRIADGSVEIQTTAESNPSPPSWFGEVALLSGYLRTHGVLSKIVAHSRTTSKREGWWIEQETAGSSLTSMAHVRPPA